MSNSLRKRDARPVLTGEELNRPDGKWRRGGVQISAEEGRAAFRAKLRGKTRINIHLDNDVVAYFKGEAGARGGYQTLINNALRRMMEGVDLKDDLIQAIDERMRKLVEKHLAPSVLRSEYTSTRPSGRAHIYQLPGGRGEASEVAANTVNIAREFHIAQHGNA